MNKISQEQINAELIAILRQLLSEQGVPYRREISNSDSLQGRLGIDSLTRAELFQRVEKTFSVNIPDSLLARAETVGDLADCVANAKPKMINVEKPRIITTHGDPSSVDPAQAKTLVDIIMMYGEQSPDKPHVFFQNEEGGEDVITYGELLKCARQVAGRLRDLGLKQGETVAIMQPTTPKFFYVFMGVLLAGGVPVPIYPPFRMHMLEAYAKTEAKILGNAEVRVLITFPEAEKISKLIKGFVPSLRHVVLADDLLHGIPTDMLATVQADQAAFIQYTSGSTNDPKGVLLSHDNLISNVGAYGKAINITATDVVVSWLPLYHDFGLIGAWLGSLYHGIPLILMTPFSFLSHPERWLWMMHYHRGTLSGAPNFAYELCVKKVQPSMIEGLDLSSWRVAANGAEKVYPRTLEAFAEKFEPYGFKRSAIMPVYGLAESTVGLVIPPLGRDFKVDHVDRMQFEEKREAVPSTDKKALEFASCGVPLAGHEVRIVDDHNKALPERHVGRLQFKGPSSMQGYYNNPEATAAIRHEGYYDSGDLAYEADGEFYITGRRKDLIIKAGRNIYPAEIEELVGDVAGVRQGCVAAFATVDEQSGTESLVVVAETKEKKKEKREEIITAINQAVATALDIPPDEVVLVAPRTVPKTSSGKLQRAACKNMYVAGKIGRLRMPASLQIARLGGKWLLSKFAKLCGLIGKTIYTLYLLGWIVLSALPLYLTMRFASTETAGRTMKMWSRAILFLAFCPLRIQHKERLDSNECPMIYVANHASYIDAIIAMAIAPADTRFVMKKEVFSWPLIGVFARKLKYIGVDRVDLSKGLEDTKGINTTLKEGQSIFIFPEGTFGYAAGLRPFRLGAFKIAAEADVPVCPLSIRGARTILRDEEFLVRPGVITVTVSEPIKGNGAEWDDITALRAAVRAEIAKYCGEPSLDLIAAQVVAPPKKPAHS